MKTVRIITNYGNSGKLFRQTPQSQGIWGEYSFTNRRVTDCDYVVVMNYSNHGERVLCNEKNVWCLQQEPHNEYFGVYHKYAPEVYARVFTPDESLKGPRYVHSHGALPWHVERSYDDLKKNILPEKERNLSIVTSSKQIFRGHKARMGFLKSIAGRIDVDVFGYGIRPLLDKWDGLAPYRYSIVIENFSSAHYWTEKLADCYLSWTLPFYYGCKNLSQYFPSESFVSIDIKKPDEALSIIEDTINENMWKKRLDAISQARELILEKYQLFPFLTEYIAEWDNKNGHNDKKIIVIPGENSLPRHLFFSAIRVFRYFR